VNGLRQARSVEDFPLQGRVGPDNHGALSLGPGAPRRPERHSDRFSQPVSPRTPESHTVLGDILGGDFFLDVSGRNDQRHVHLHAALPPALVGGSGFLRCKVFARGRQPIPKVQLLFDVNGRLGKTPFRSPIAGWARAFDSPRSAEHSELFGRQRHPPAATAGEALELHLDGLTISLSGSGTHATSSLPKRNQKVCSQPRLKYLVHSKKAKFSLGPKAPAMFRSVPAGAGQ
jgi:hypothetical protein